jgi:acetyltransferase
MADRSATTMTDTTSPEHRTTLRGGRRVCIRAARISDEAELLQAFERLSPEARYMRFMRAVREPDLSRLRQALAGFPATGVGLVATVPAADGIDIVGSCVCLFAADGRRGEFAISVAADYGGAGLGSALMRVLIDACHDRGLQEMDGYVLAINKPMLKLAGRLGFGIAPDPDDRSVCIVRLPLAAGLTPP